VSLPGGWAPGDFAVMWGYCDQYTSSNTIETANPDGWTEFAALDSAAAFLRCWWRFLQAGDTNPTIDVGGSGSWGTESSAGAILLYRNIDPLTPLDGVAPVINAGTGSPITTAGVTTQTQNAIVLTLSGRGDDEAHSGQSYGGSSADVYERLDAGTTAGDDSQLCAWEKTLVSPGASGTASATTSASDPYIAVTFALRVVNDFVPPYGTWTVPASDFAICSGSSVALTVTAGDADSGVAGVQFKNVTAGVDIGAEDTSSPYSVTWDTSTVEDGVYQLGATIRDDGPQSMKTTLYRWVEVANRADVADPSGGVRFP
jgi:hypothetical protein